MSQTVPSSSAEAGAKRVRVLLVEDDRSVSKPLGALLQRRGYDAAVVESIAEAMRSLEPAPDLAIVDLMLPDGLGWRIIEAMRDRKLGTRVVVVTGVEDEELLRPMAWLQPITLLRKPTTLATLLGAMGIA